jgi:sec-independent protein translocase protein TatA
MFAIGFGGQEIAIIAVILVLLFGGKKIPELFRGLGEGMREFKKSARGLVEEDKKEKKEEDKPEEQG